MTETDDLPIYIVDWDGTCVEDVYPEWGDWLPGAREALRTLLDVGRVKIHSSRLNPYHFGHDGEEGQKRPPSEWWADYNSIRAMLDVAGLGNVEIHITKGKPSGHYYIDNRGVAFRGSWDDVLVEVLPRKLRTWSEPVAWSEKVVESDPRNIRDFPTEATIRKFSTGATRDTDEGKLCYAGFFSPQVLERRAQYMHQHRIQSDGSLRAPDNWKKGIPLDAYMDSLARHFIEVWKGHHSQGDIQDALCAVMFNCEGMLFELLQNKTEEKAA